MEEDQTEEILTVMLSPTPNQRERIQAMVFDLTWPFCKKNKKKEPGTHIYSELSRFYVQLMFMLVTEHTPSRMAVLLHAAQLWPAGCSKA